MQTSENSQHGKKSAKLAGMGRPRTRPVGESTVLSLKVEDELIRLLDEEVAVQNQELPKGRSALSRGELVRLALYEWLAAKAKARAERKTPRQ